MMHPFLSCTAFGKTIARLGLASHGSRTRLTPDDVRAAIDRGVSFLNWAGVADGPAEPDAFCEAIASLGRRREQVVVCVQLWGRTGPEARAELDTVLAMLGTDHVDVVTLYYVEREDEWSRIRGPGGSLEVLRRAREAGQVRHIGLTSHQRLLAAAMARTGDLDALMIRYNAAHRGAEREVFPVTRELGLPVIAYTALRWGALLEKTPEDPPGFVVPPAPAWYRFVLQAPEVSVVLTAPHTRAELDEDLRVLDASGPLEPAEHARLAEHGARVRKHAGQFW